MTKRNDCKTFAGVYFLAKLTDHFQVLRCHSKWLLKCFEEKIRRVYAKEISDGKRKVFIIYLKLDTVLA